MITILNINNQKFSLNGIQYYKNFIAHVISNKLRIINAYDSNLVLVEFLNHTEFSVNGNVFNNLYDLLEVLLPVIFSRGNSNADIGPVSATQSGIVDNTSLQELGGVDKRINGVRIGKGNGNNSDNLVFGFEALNANQPNTTTYEGTSNVAIGSRALKENISGHSNLAVGGQALTANTTGTYNTAIGGSSLAFNTTGIENTAIGAYTLYQNLSGRFNIAIGSGTLQRNVSGSRNIAIGKGALNNCNSDRNIAMGLNSGSGITSGSGNTIIGDSGNTTTGISTGSFNAIFAPNLGAVTGITTGSGNVVIGKVTGLDADSQNTVTIANGIGEIRFRVNTAGLVTIPSQTNALINDDTSGKAAVTKEYLGSKELNATATLDFPEAFTSNSPRLTATVTGAAVGDLVLVSGPALPAGCFYTSFVSAANTVSITLHNMNNGPVNLPSSEFKIKVFK